MSQFDVHRNTGRNAAAIPCVVVVFDKLKRRIVVPLVAAGHADIPRSALNPVFTVAGIEVMLNPLEIVSVSIDALGERLGSLSEAGDTIVAALDEVFTRAWG